MFGDFTAQIIHGRAVEIPVPFSVVGKIRSRGSSLPALSATDIAWTCMFLRSSARLEFSFWLDF